jgi:serine/threonine protein phosphatase PrpC
MITDIDLGNIENLNNEIDGLNIDNNINSYNIENNNTYDIGTSNYETLTYPATKSQNYSQYNYEENKNDYITNLKTISNPNTYNLNTIHEDLGENNYSPYSTSKYSTKTNSPNIISSFDTFPIDNIPRITNRSNSSNKYISSSTKLSDTNLNIYNAIFSDIEPKGNLSYVKGNYTTEINGNQISDDEFINNLLKADDENKGEILDNDEINKILKKEEEDDPLINIPTFSNPKRDFLIKSARFPTRTLDINTFTAKQALRQKRKHPKINNDIRYSVPLKMNQGFNIFQNNLKNIAKKVEQEEEIINNSDILRYSMPLKMAPTFSTFQNNLKNKDKKYQIKGREIKSDNNSKEYFKESKGGLVKNYAYHEESNAEFRNYMEDRGKAVENLNGDPDKIIFCIFDGHGGQQVSQFLQENFATYMKKMLPFKNHFEEITRLFKDLDEKVKELNVPLVGSTATVVYIERKNGKRMLYCANVGDSRCVLVNKKGIMRLSKDDRTDDPIERKRIIKEGGTIVNGRVDGILMLTRSFGDWRLKDSGVIVDPHIMRIEINDDDLYLIIASDGLWDAIKDEECKRITQSNPYTLEICKNFVVESLNKLSQDNISCFVISFK